MRRTLPAFHLRRTIQAGALLAFLVLLFWVSWPHSTRPAQVSGGWMPVALERATGRATLARQTAPQDAPAPGATVYAVDESDGQRDLGPFRVLQAGAQEAVVVPAGPLGADERACLAESIGPWSLRETPPGAWPSHFADDLAAKERLPGETFLMLDPMVSISTGIASGHWSGSALWAAAILLVCLVVPRAFCAYLCPLGTLVDLFDRALGKRRRRLPAPRWLGRIRFVVLAAVLAAAAGGLLLAGFVAPIPLLGRGLADAFSPLLQGMLRGWHQVPPWGPGQAVSIGLLLAVLSLGLLRPRFWCRYVCPSGAIFSLASLPALFRRQVGSRCTGCGRCAEKCPLGAADSGGRGSLAECGFCRTCARVCPTDAVRFVPRWTRLPEGEAGDHTSGRSRRHFLNTAASAAAAALAAGMGTKALGAKPPRARLCLRPPGSVPEDHFLRLCIRCGACLRACPSGVLRAVGLDGGLEGLWTPRVDADWSGCEPSCNRCGQLCPTGAIRALPLEEKRAARIGLAAVDASRCLPHAGQGDCRLCVDDCASAGYAAIEIVRVRTEVDAAGRPLEDSGYAAPRVIAQKCVGCGLCQSRCRAINVVEKRLLARPAIVIEAGPGKEDRLMVGSYDALRGAETSRNGSAPDNPSRGADDYLPDF